MTQEAIVIRTLPNQMAEVLVKRPTACGGSCGSCESCIYQSELRAFARNLINAAPGQKVTISTESGRVYSAALLVYIVRPGLCCGQAPRGLGGPVHSHQLPLPDPGGPPADPLPETQNGGESNPL